MMESGIIARIPLGGVGGTIREAADCSRFPQSWQKIKWSGFSRPQRSQITARRGPCSVAGVKIPFSVSFIFSDRDGRASDNGTGKTAKKLLGWTPS